MTNRLTELSELLVKNNLKIKEGESVLIMTFHHSFSFAESLAAEIIKIKAFPYIIIESDYLIKIIFEQDNSFLSSLPFPLLSILKKVDYVIRFPELLDPTIINRIPEDKFMSYRSARSLALVSYYIHRNQTSTRKIKWATVLFPTSSMAKLYNLTLSEYTEIMMNAYFADPKQMAKKALAIAKYLYSGNKVEINSSNGTNLSFSIKNRRPYIEDGTFTTFADYQKVYAINLPAGEICIAPIETSANGTINFDETYLNFAKKVKNLKLKYSNGRLTSISGGIGINSFKKLLRTATGDKEFIGEFGIGLNTSVKKLTGNYGIDEKMYGTIHISNGENRVMGGKNISSFHHDLILKNPTFFIDGCCIMKNGEILI